MVGKLGVGVARYEVYRRIGKTLIVFVENVCLSNQAENLKGGSNRL
jgi:hypothetical protein